MRGLGASPPLITTNFAMCIHNLSNVASLAQVSGSSTWDTTRDSFDSCTRRHRSSFPRVKPMHSVTTPAKNSESLSLQFACRASLHAVARSIHHVLVLSEVERTSRRKCLLAWTRTQGPCLHTEIVLSCVQKKVPSPTVAMASVQIQCLWLYRDLTAFPFIRRAQPVSKIDFRRYVFLPDPRIRLKIFHLRDFSLISSLDFAGGKSVDQRTLVTRSNCQFCVWPILFVDIEFQFVLTTDVNYVSCGSCFLRDIFLQRTWGCKCSERSVLIHLVRQVLHVGHGDRFDSSPCKL